MVIANNSVERAFDPAVALLPQAVVRVKCRSPMSLYLGGST